MPDQLQQPSSSPSGDLSQLSDQELHDTTVQVCKEFAALRIVADIEAKKRRSQWVVYLGGALTATAGAAINWRPGKSHGIVAAAAATAAAIATAWVIQPPPATPGPTPNPPVVVAPLPKPPERTTSGDDAPVPEAPRQDDQARQPQPAAAAPDRPDKPAPVPDPAPEPEPPVPPVEPVGKVCRLSVDLPRLMPGRLGDRLRDGLLCTPID